MLPFFGAPFSALSLMLYKFPKMMIVSTANTATNFISVCQKSFQRYMYFVWVRAYVSFETLVGNRYHYFTRIGLFPCFSLWSLVEIEKLQLVCRRQSREWWRERAVPILLVPIFPPRQLRQKCFHCHCHCQCHCQRQCRCHQLEIENCFLKLFSGDAKAFIIYAAIPGYVCTWYVSLLGVLFKHTNPVTLGHY